MRGSKPYDIEQLGSKHYVSFSRLQRAEKGGSSEKEVLEASNGRGRRQRLTQEEEKMIADCIVQFKENGARLDRECLRDLAQTLVKTFYVNSQV